MFVNGKWDCVRMRAIGKDFLEMDDGSSGYACAGCSFSAECGKKCRNKDTLRMFEAK